jgi:hypothetical protein
MARRLVCIPLVGLLLLKNEIYLKADKFKQSAENNNDGRTEKESNKKKVIKRSKENQTQATLAQQPGVNVTDNPRLGVQAFVPANPSTTPSATAETTGAVTADGWEA